MKIILKSDVEALGGAGDIVDVKDGYANNFLVPRGLAMKATRGAVADAEAMRRSRVKREAHSLGEAQELAALLEKKTVTIRAKAGEDGTLYGSVGNSGVATAIKDQLGITIDRRRIPMDKPFKHIGAYEVPVRVHSQLVATVKVEVVGGE